MYDRMLIGKLVEWTIDTTYGSWPAAERETKVPRATLYRVRAGDPRIKPRTLARIESALGFPAGTFALVAVHDFAGLREIGVRPDLIGWLERQEAGGGASVAV